MNQETSNVKSGAAVACSALLDRIAEEIWNTPAGEPVPQPNPRELENFWDCALLCSRHNEGVRQILHAWLKADGAKEYRARLAKCDIDVERSNDRTERPGHQ